MNTRITTGMLAMLGGAMALLTPGTGSAANVGTYGSCFGGSKPSSNKLFIESICLRFESRNIAGGVFKQDKTAELVITQLARHIPKRTDNTMSSGFSTNENLSAVQEPLQQRTVEEGFRDLRVGDIS